MRASPGSRRSIVRKVGGVFLSVVVGGLGIATIALGLDHDFATPAFAVLVGTGFVVLAIWNVATLERTSEYPEGPWLVGLSTLALAAGVVGLTSGSGRLGVELSLLGAIGGVAAVRSRRSGR